MRIRMLHNVIQDGPVDTSKGLDVEKMLRRKLTDAVELRRRLGLPSEVREHGLAAAVSTNQPAAD